MRKLTRKQHPRRQRQPSARWIARLETLVEGCTDALRGKLDAMSPEQLASIMGIASEQITSYRALIPQGDDIDDQASSAAPSDR